VDGAVMLHEIVHELNRKKLQGVILKIDFEKAYDSVRWDFVEEVMIRKGFDQKLRGWIMKTMIGGQCVCGYKWNEWAVLQNLQRFEIGGSTVTTNV
jgi:hypothetical protein